MNKNDVELHMDWVSHKAAKYACENWHYSGCTPKFKQLYIGVWEDKKFIGVVSFGRSSTPYLGNAYGLSTTECAELTRIALRSHKTPVSRIMSIALKMIKKQSIGMRLIVSLADPLHGHNGGIYQATNWIYVGRSSANTQYYFRGKWRNDSSLMRYLQKNPKERESLPKRKVEGKYKYLMPLDKNMRKQIEKLSKPYPKKSCPIGVTGNTVDSQSADGGSNPTVGLNSKITNG